MQLSVMRTRLRKRIGNPDSTDVTDSTLDQHINDAYRDIATKYHHHRARKLCEFPTVTSQSSYGLPTTVGAVLKVIDTTNDKKLKKLGPRRYAEMDFASPDDGKPVWYIRLRQFVTLMTDDGGAPDGIYTIRIHYTDTITDLAEATDTPVIPIPWHVGIILLARWYYHDEQGDNPKAAYALNAWRSWLSDRSTEIEEELMADMDSGVEVPTLTQQDPRLNFDQSA